MSPRCLERPVLNAMVAPVERIVESPLYAKLLGMASVVLSYIQSAELVWKILLALAAAGIYDTIVGRAAAVKRNEKTTVETMKAGFLTKLTGIVLVLLIHYLETSLGAGTGPASLATGIALVLIVMEMESIEGHRIALGARPIPGFSALLSKLRTFEARLLVAANAPAPAKPKDPEV